MITRILSISFVLSSSFAVACSCPSLDFTSGAAAAGVVFEGVVDDDPFESNYTDYVYVIRVTRVFKGDVLSRVLATTTASTCGVFPARGVPWIFMFHPDAVGRVSYEMSPCGIASSEASYATPSEMASLGPGYPPRELATRHIAASIILAFISVSAIWRFRRRRAS